MDKKTFEYNQIRRMQVGDPEQVGQGLILNRRPIDKNSSTYLQY